MFTPYLITYDNSYPRDYGALYKLMADIGAVRLAQSVWLLTTAATAKAIRDAISATLQSDDRVAVVQLQSGGHWAARNVSFAAGDWLSGHISMAEAA